MISVVIRRLGTEKRWGSRSLCALAVCLTLSSLLLWCQSARATCGDYVIFRPQSPAAPVSFDHLSRMHIEMILPAEAPCNTPLCRGSKPAEPVPVPPTPQQIDQRPLAILAVAVEAECSYRAGRGWRRQDEMPLDGFRLSLLRPPCA